MIDRLAKVNAAGIGFSPTMTGAQFLPNEASDEPGMLVLGQPPPERSDLLKRFVAVGEPALTVLSRHLDDARPTMLPSMKAMMWASFDERPDDNRRHHAMPTDPDSAPEAPFDYQVTVGDLCYVALGQILNRHWSAVRYQPTGGLVIASPVRSERLRKRARAIVARHRGPEAHRDRLVLDLRSPDFEGRRIGALRRLSFYYPEAVEAAVDVVLGLPRYDVFAVHDFVRGPLYAARGQAARRQAFSAFVAAQGPGARAGIERLLFDDLDDLEAQEEGRRSEPPSFTTQPRELLGLLFGHPTSVRSAQRPWLDAIAETERERFVAESKGR
jgi:hypothetical protein